MENFDILGVHGKIRVLEGGGWFTKNQYIGGSAQKGALGQFADLRGA